ncbi:MAG: hypothetical protein KC431_21295, partial [Myxococcales bacterium]|nr:hypothetical protein [Myxococcales bacterium]
AEGPIKQLAASAANNADLKDFAGLGMAYPVFKAQYEGVKGMISQSGVKLDRGMLLADVDGHSYIIYAGDKPEALSELVKMIDPKAGADMRCKATDSAGYIVCADNDGDLGAYAAGGAEGATAVRARWSAGLPGVDFEEANVIADAEGVFMTMQTPPGLVVMSMAPPQDEPEFQKAVAALSPAQGKLLGTVQPGAGFIWANVNRAMLTETMVKEMVADPDTPPAAKELAAKINGEFLLAGHYDPASVALQMGLDDTNDWAGVADALGKDIGKAQKDFDKDFKVEGGKWDVGMVDIPVDTGTVKAMHAGLSGVPEADVLAQLTGLTIDGWVFASDGALNVALGASPEAIGHVAANADAGATPGLKAYLPPTLTAAYEANQVSMIAHVPLDALHGPQTRQLLAAALKNVPEFSPELAIAFFDLAAPLSSGTMWMTHNGGKAQLHMAMQSIG